MAAAGITSVEGRVIGDDQAFDDEGLGAGWAWDYLQYDYAAPVGALEFNENTATLLVAPGTSPGSSPIVSLSPGSGLTLVNLATTGAQRFCGHDRFPSPPGSHSSRSDRLGADWRDHHVSGKWRS